MDAHPTLYIYTIILSVGVHVEVMELWKDSGMCKYLLAQDDGLMVNCATRGSCMSYIGS